MAPDWAGLHLPRCAICPDPRRCYREYAEYIKRDEAQPPLDDQNVGRAPSKPASSKTLNAPTAMSTTTPTTYLPLPDELITFDASLSL